MPGRRRRRLHGIGAIGAVGGLLLTMSVGCDRHPDANTGKVVISALPCDATVDSGPHDPVRVEALLGGKVVFERVIAGATPYPLRLPIGTYLFSEAGEPASLRAKLAVRAVVGYLPVTRVHLVSGCV